MALYNSPTSCTFEAATAIAAALPECASFRELCEVATAEEAGASIKIGFDEVRPLDGEAFTVEELQAQRFCATVQLPIDGSGLIVQKGRQRGEYKATGLLFVLVRRLIRESESPLDAYLFFADRMARVAECELVEVVNQTGVPWIASIGFGDGPVQNDNKSRAAQGEFHWCYLRINWGQAEG